MNPVIEDELREALGDKGFEVIKSRVESPDPEMSDTDKAAIKRADNLGVGIEEIHANVVGVVVTEIAE